MVCDVIGSKSIKDGTLVWRDNEAKIAGWESLSEQENMKWHYSFGDIWEVGIAPWK